MIQCLVDDSGVELYNMVANWGIGIYIFLLGLTLGVNLY